MIAQKQLISVILAQIFYEVTRPFFSHRMYEDALICPFLLNTLMLKSTPTQE